MPKPIRLTKEDQEARWAKCIGYLEKTPDMPVAMKAAARDGFYCNTSVWITALGKMLGQGREPGDRKEGTER